MALVICIVGSGADFWGSQAHPNLRVVSRYIELNPVRAGMVAHPAEYPWSSYQYNALGSPIELITPHFLYQGLAKTEKTRQKRYAALFDKIIPDYTLEEIRSSINRAWVLGDERFKRQIEKQTGRRASPLARGENRKSDVYRAKN